MIAALVLARSESWCLGLTLRAACLYCDAIVFTDHRSDDATPDIAREVCAEMAVPLNYERIDDEHWDEMDVRQRMLARGRSLGADRFVIVDTDEVLTANVVPLARQLVGQCASGTAGALPMVATYHSLHRRRHDGVWGDRSRLTWCFYDDGLLRWSPDPADRYQHHMRAPRGCPNPPAFLAGSWPSGNADLNWGGVFHLQYASLARLKAKAAWYKIVETIRWPGRMSPQQLNQKYDWTLREEAHPDRGAPEFSAIPDAWWRGYLDRGWGRYIDLAAESWQARDARRLYAEFRKVSPDAFAGLELHGII